MTDETKARSSAILRAVAYVSLSGAIVATLAGSRFEAETARNRKSIDEMRARLAGNIQGEATYTRVVEDLLRVADRNGPIRELLLRNGYRDHVERSAAKPDAVIMPPGVQ